MFLLPCGAGEFSIILANEIELGNSVRGLSSNVRFCWPFFCFELLIQRVITSSNPTMAAGRVQIDFGHVEVRHSDLKWCSIIQLLIYEIFGFYSERLNLTLSKLLMSPIQDQL